MTTQLKRFEGVDSKGRKRELHILLDKKRWEFLICLHSEKRCLGDIRVGFNWLLKAVQPANYHGESE